MRPIMWPRSRRRPVAVKEGGKRVTCHTFCHSFVTHLLEGGYDIRTVQELLGREDVKTIIVYTHVLNRGGRALRAPSTICNVDDL